MVLFLFCVWSVVSGILYWLVLAFWGCFYCAYKVFVFSLAGWACVLIVLFY